MDKESKVGYYWGFIVLVLTTNPEEYSGASSSFNKPTICECHTAFMDDVREAMSGDASTSSKLTNVIVLQLRRNDIC